MRRERFFCFILVLVLAFGSLPVLPVTAEDEKTVGAAVQEGSATVGETETQTEAPVTEAPVATEAPAAEIPASAEAVTEAPMASETPATEAPDAAEAPETTEAPEEARFSKGYALLKAGTKVYSDERCASLWGELAEKTVVYVAARQETENAQRDILRFAYAEDGTAQSAYVRADAATPLSEEEAKAAAAKQSEVYYQNDRALPLFALPLMNEAETEASEATEIPEEAATPVPDTDAAEGNPSEESTAVPEATEIPEEAATPVPDTDAAEGNPSEESTAVPEATEIPEEAATPVPDTDAAEGNPSEESTAVPEATEIPEEAATPVPEKTAEAPEETPIPIEEDIPVIDGDEVPTVDEDFEPAEIDIPDDDDEALTEEEESAANETPKVKSLVICVDGEETDGKVTLDRADSDSYLLTADIEPETADWNVKWSVSSKSYADVDEDGWLTLKKNGTFTVTCKALDGSNKSTTLRVTAVNLIKEIFLSGPDAMRSGAVEQMTATFSPMYPTDANDIVWSSSDEAVAAVNAKGQVTAKTVAEPTYVYITAATKDGGIESNTHEILVRPPAQAVEIQIGGASCTQQTLDLAYEEPELALFSAVYPEGAFQRVTWSSSNKKVATVDEEGIVTAHAAGTATITATAADGSKKSAFMKLTVLYSVTGIFLTGDTELAGGKSLTLSAEVLPEGAANKKLTWTTSNKAVATVSSSGKVTAKKVTQVQTVTITATAKDGSGVSDSMTLTVRPQVKSISILAQDGSVLPSVKTIVFEEDGQNLYLQAQVLPENAGKTVKWKSSNEKIAYVDEQTGVVTLHKKGNVTITATATDGSGVKKTVKLQGVTLVNSISVSFLDQLAGGCSATAKASVLPADATNKKVYWYTDDTDYISVHKTSGKVTAKKVTQAVTVSVRAEAQDGSGIVSSASFTLSPAIQTMRIVKDGTPITALSLDAADVAENTAQLGVRFEPETACPSGRVTWKSSNAKIASVDENGLVTAVKNGTVTLTATAQDGSNKRATVRLTVKTKVQRIDAEELYYVGLKQTVSLKAGVYPATASDKKLTYKSQNAKIAAVTSSGRVTGKSEGETTIIISAKDGSVQKSVSVSVLPAAASISILDEDRNKVNGKTISLKLPTNDDGMIETVYYTLTTEILPLDGCTEAAWSVSPAGIVSLKAQSGGQCSLRLLKGGTATVTAKTVDGSNKSAKVKISVTKPVSLIGIEGPKELAKGKSAYLTTWTIPNDPTNKGVRWESLSPDIISVTQDGKITAQASAGTAVIVATPKDGLEGVNAAYTVSILPKAEEITLYYSLNPAASEDTETDSAGDSIAPVENRLTVTANDTDSVYLRAVISPEEASQRVTVTSSVPSVAAVFPMEDDEAPYYAANLQIYKRGTTVITVTAQDGTKIKQSFTLEVLQQAESIEISGDTYLVSGQRAQLRAAVYPSTASSKEVAWGFEQGDTDYSAYAVITAKGIITAKTVTEPTEIVVTATAKDDSGVYGTWTMMLYPTEQDVPSAAPAYRAVVVVEPTATKAGILKRQNDVDGMADMLRMQRINGQAFQSVKVMHQTSASQVLSALSALAGEANGADVTYFYFLGHGDTNGTILFYDNSSLTAANLKGALDKIPGRVVVFLANCYSGYYVAGNSAANAISTADLTDEIPEDTEITDVPPSAFTDSIISVFSKGDDAVTIPLTRGCSVVSANIGELRKSKYYVLTASLYNEQSWFSYYTNNDGSIDESRSFDRFTRGLCSAGGWDSVTKTTTWSGSKTVTLAQAYALTAAYVKSFTDHQSSVQVYPASASFVIFQH